MSASPFSRWLLAVCVAPILLVIAYLLFWPVVVEPRSWSAPVAPAYEGDYRVNQKLARFEALTLDGQVGPEGVVVDARGNVFAATEAGWIIRWSSEALAAGHLEGEKWVNTQGRPLGLTIAPSGELWIADAFRGVLKLQQDGHIMPVITQHDGQPLVYANDLTFAPNGRLYFTESTTRFSAKAYNSTYKASLIDLMEHGDTGRLFEYDPKTQRLKQLFSGLSFANGVAADPAGQYVLVNETGEYRIWKHWLAGERAGQSEVLVDNLPGFPDNLYLGRQAAGQEPIFWLGFTSPRLPVVDALADKPWLRKVVQRLPGFVRPKAKHYGHVIAVSGEGRVLVNLQDPAAGYPLTTGVAQTADYLYISSLVAPVLARVPSSVLQK